MSKHPIIHVEFSTTNRETDANFYSEVFGWKFQQIPEMNYATFDTEAGVGGGLNPISQEFPAGSVTVYIETDDIDATLAKIEALGGQTIAPKMEIPGVGWFAVFKDLTGNQLALLTPLPM